MCSDCEYCSRSTVEASCFGEEPWPNECWPEYVFGKFDIKDSARLRSTDVRNFT